MSRINALLSMTTHGVAFASGAARVPVATTATQAHTVVGLLVVLIFAAICISLVSRVSSALAGLVAQLLETAAAVGRMLMMLVVFGIIAVLLLIHI